MAKICNDIEECALHIRSGKLVAFPTETVYGLGANALDPTAVLSIFQAKKRPLTDPVIVHVNSLEQAYPLISETDTDILQTFEHLATMFWPGPLTLVLKASSLIPDSLTANTGFIGLRAPNHPIAIQLIDKAKVPIAAPSANLFSHVSPTLAQHVIDDFSDSLFDIKVIDGNKCSFGIESTVAKICKENEEVVVKIFRRGGVSDETLQKALENIAKVYYFANFSGVDTSNEAPGQLIKHYSPNVETYLLETGDSGTEICEASKAVFIDFNSKSAAEFKSVIQLSECGNVDEAINNLYESLRIAEVQGGECIVIGLNDMSGDHSLALWDRVYRATSGRKVVLKNDKIYNKS